MRTLVRWAVKLYPAAWRARYGGELEALMEDAGVRGGDVWDLVRGALFMQVTSWNFAKIVAAFTLAGVLAAGVWAVSQPKRYESTAVMRMSSPEGGGGVTSSNAQQQRLQRLQQGALSRASLAAIIQAQNLFPNERRTLPMEDVIQQMRNRNIQIRMIGVAPQTTFAVNYSASKPEEAQAAARAIVTALVEQNVTQARAAGEGPANIEVIDPASLPSEPTIGDRKVMWRLVALGLALGLMCGTLWWAFQRTRVSLWRIGGCAAAGMAVGLGIAFMLPNEYISTAVLRTADAAAMQSTATRVLSQESVAAMIRRNGLFTKEVSSDGLEAVTRKVRDKRLRVQSLAVNGTGMSAYVVSFQYPDRFTAQRVTRDLVGQFMGQPNTEILDPASDPQAPSSPNRLTIALLGMFGGVLLGLAAGYRRREKFAAA